MRSKAFNRHAVCARLKAAAATLAVLVLSAAAPGAQAACQLQQAMAFKVTMAGNEPLIDASINGRPVRFLVDTGAFNSSLFRSAADRMKLPVTALDGRVYGVDGGAEAGTVELKELKLGDVVVPNFSMGVVGNADPADAGREPVSNMVVGVIGQEILSKYDLELDLAHNVIRLLVAKDCAGGQVVYWPASYAMAQMTSIANPDAGEAIRVRAMVNGRPVTAEIDTGSDTSAMTVDGIKRTGVPVEDAQGNKVDGGVVGVAGRPMDAYFVTVPTLSVGEETINKAKLQIAKLFKASKEARTDTRIEQDVADFPDLLLGADFVKAHRIYVAWKQGKIYFSYAGGPVFQSAGAPPEAAAPKP